MMCNRTYDNIQLDDSPVDFEKTSKGFTDNPSQTDDLNNDLEIERKLWQKHAIPFYRSRYILK